MYIYLANKPSLSRTSSAEDMIADIQTHIHRSTHTQTDRHAHHNRLLRSAIGPGGIKRQCLDVALIVVGEVVAGQFGSPEPLVLVKELAMSSDPVPRPHLPSSAHLLAHHEVVHEAPPGEQRCGELTYRRIGR